MPPIRYERAPERQGRKRLIKKNTAELPIAMTDLERNIRCDAYSPVLFLPCAHMAIAYYIADERGKRYTVDRIQHKDIKQHSQKQG
jgi:hypothetical protein